MTMKKVEEESQQTVLNLWSVAFSAGFRLCLTACLAYKKRKSYTECLFSMCFTALYYFETLLQPQKKRRKKRNY